MSKTNVDFFYRCGGNYKYHFSKDIDTALMEKFIKDNTDEDFTLDDLIDKDCSSDTLFELEDFGLTTRDLPIQWDDELDHNYVSITAIGGLK